MIDRYQAGYRAALDEVAKQARVDAADHALPSCESALNALADWIERQEPEPDTEPLTVERAREWMDGDADRIETLDDYRKGDDDRAALYDLISEYGEDRHLDAFASLLVDAANGRIK